MRKEKALTALLRDFVAVVAEEADRNPAFAARLDDLLSPVADPNRAAPRGAKPLASSGLDLHHELASRGEEEFRHWLRSQSTPILRACIREQDLDPAKRTKRWTEPEKLADFIAEGMRARVSRGSAFMGRGETT